MTAGRLTPVPAVLGHGGDEGALSGCGQRVNGDDRGDGLVREARRPPRSLDAAVAAGTDPHDASVRSREGVDGQVGLLAAPSKGC